MKQKLTKTVFGAAGLLALILTACTVPLEGDGDAGARVAAEAGIGDVPAIPLPAYTLVSIPGGTVDETNTGVGNTTNWGAGANPAYTKPCSIGAFYIGETEITWELWSEVYNWAVGNDYTFAHPGTQGGSTEKSPVIEISWRDAVVWCNAYSEAMEMDPVYFYNGDVLRESEPGPLEDPDGVDAGDGKAENSKIDATANGFRLPTEAEWEYAARGGVPSLKAPWIDTFAGTDDPNLLGNYAWYNVNSGGAPNPVGTRLDNGIGLYDMSGNVEEWCQNEVSPYGVPDREQRGGSFFNVDKACAVAARDSDDPCYGYETTGFRVISNPPESPAR